MSADEKEAKKVIVPKTAADVQRFKLQKLLKNPEKPVFIPEKPEEKLPRVFKPPEFVRNIWGSSAGAGSGDFHVYRGVRRREYARQKFLNEKSDKKNLDEEFQKRLKEHKTAAEERTAKKRAKRLKKKMNQKAKKAKPMESTANGKDDNASEESEESEDENQEFSHKEKLEEEEAELSLSAAKSAQKTHLTQNSCSENSNSSSDANSSSGHSST